MSKIAIIGAGSVGFTRRFLADIFTEPELAEQATVSLMDISQENLDLMVGVAHRMVDQLGVPTKVEATTDQRTAVDGADYVISVLLSYGDIGRRLSGPIARKYGVFQPVACTNGPGGVFDSMVQLPVLLSICKDMEELCPEAWFLNYTGAQSILPWALSYATTVRQIGMCHSVQGTARRLARYIGAPYEETQHWVAGVNHQAWFLRFEWNGDDAYPLLWELMEDAAIYEEDMVRWEMMRTFEYFLTESSVHNAEYAPYFLKRPELIERFIGPLMDRYGDLMAWEEARGKRVREQVRQENESGAPIEFTPGHEYSVGVIHAMETDTPYRFNGNVINTGLITNLPQGSCVEVPCLADGMGVHPCYVGDLPPQCASINRGRIAGDELAVKAALEADRKAAEQAVALDPLTAAVCTLDEIRDMVAEAFVALQDYLPQFR